MKILVRRLYYGNKITASEIKTAYEKAFRVSWWHRLLGYADFKFADRAYKQANLDAINSVLAADKTDKEKYIAEDFDCDDFAFALVGAFHKNRRTAEMPIFLTWVQTPAGGHAVVSFYFGGAVAIIEPQTDEVFRVPADWQLILLCG